jgi:hypothetical protein
MIASGNCIAAHTDVLCYFLAIVAHATCCGLITLPLPMLVFFWGTLASPRPSRMFWIVMIAYTEIVILIKFIFQVSISHYYDTALKNYKLTLNLANSPGEGRKCGITHHPLIGGTTQGCGSTHTASLIFFTLLFRTLASPHPSRILMRFVDRIWFLNILREIKIKVKVSKRI